MPAEGADGVFVPEVAGLVALDLRLPEGVAGFREAEVGTVFMPVPETAVDEDDGTVFRQDQVGPAGERPVVRPVDREAVAETVEHGSQGEFRLGVATPDAGHDF